MILLFTACTGNTATVSKCWTNYEKLTYNVYTTGTTNKVGDFLGENPKMRNRAVRSLPGGRFIYPFLEEQETEQQKADREAREQVYDLLGR